MTDNKLTKGDSSLENENFDRVKEQRPVWGIVGFYRKFLSNVKKNLQTHWKILQEEKFFLDWRISRGTAAIEFRPPYGIGQVWRWILLNHRRFLGCHICRLDNKLAKKGWNFHLCQQNFDQKPKKVWETERQLVDLMHFTIRCKAWLLGLSFVVIFDQKTFLRIYCFTNPGSTIAKKVEK